MDLVRALPLQNQERIEQILDQAARRYGGPEETPAAFYADRKARIERYVEEPCRALTERLLDMGHRTHASNAYGVGPKGVFWSIAEKSGRAQDGPKAMSCYFTSLANGRTYVWTLHNAFPVPEITQTVQVEDTLPYGVRELPHQLLFNAQPP
ncbi:MAG: hypothetical protein KDJ75_04660, partial [Alphaproteobacteria bacterium]|nr:hypothetical protein [Alphaproteobacteria bacterium]